MGVHVVEEHTKSGHETASVKFHCSTSSSSSSASTTLRIASAPLRLFKSRSKSQSRLALASRSCWVPEGHGRWKNNNGHVVELKDVPLLDITEPERIALQRLALSRLQEMNLGFHVEIPKIETVTTQQQPKRRPILLRKKAVTTNFFESKDKGSSGVRGAVFGIPLSQCVINDRMRIAEHDLQNPSSQDHCEEVLSALRISPNDDIKSVSSREGSLGDICGTESQDKGSTESLNSTEGVSRSGEFCSRRIGRESTTSLYGGRNQVPQVVDSCVEFLENKGLNTLGIFRVSGSKKRIRQLREDLDNNQRLTFDDSNQPHDVAQLLKEFFRELPEPLLTRDLYRAFIEIQRLRDPRRRIEAMRWLLYLLPVVHRDTLVALLTFLTKVVDASEDRRRYDGTWEMGNKMNSNNLATVFGPNLLRMSKGSSEMPYTVQSVVRAQERCDVILTVCNLIDNQKTLLKVPWMDLDAIYKSLMVDDPEVLNALLNRLLCNSGYETNNPVTEGGNGQRSKNKANEEWAMGIIQEKSKGSPILTKSIHKSEMESRFTDDQIKSKIRPLSFEKDEYGSQGNLDSMMKDRKSRQGTTMQGIEKEPYGVSASFTVTMAGKSQTQIPQLRILESDQGAQAKSRRVPYGKVRHLTTPSYVTEEMSITITIPARKQKLTRESESLMLRNLSPWGGANLYTRNNQNISSHMCGSVTTDIHMQMRATDIPRSIPNTQERWKRQEIIASEHIQL